MVGAHAAAPSVGRGDRRFVRRAVLLRPRARVRAHRAQAARRLVQKRAVGHSPPRATPGRRPPPPRKPRRSTPAPPWPGPRRRSARGVPVERAERDNARERDERACPRAPRGPRACGELPAFPSRLRTRVRRALRSLRAARSRRCALTRGKATGDCTAVSRRGCRTPSRDRENTTGALQSYSQLPVRFLFAEALIAIFHRDSRNRIRGRGLKIAGKANRIRRRPGQTVWIPRRREERGRRREKVPEKCRESISRSFFFLFDDGAIVVSRRTRDPRGGGGSFGASLDPPKSDADARAPRVRASRVLTSRASRTRERERSAIVAAARKAKPSLLPPREAAPGPTWSSLETGVTYGDRSTRMTRAQIRAGRRARRAVDRARAHGRRQDHRHGSPAAPDGGGGGGGGARRRVRARSIVRNNALDRRPLAARSPAPPPPPRRRPPRPHRLASRASSATPRAIRSPSS